MSNHGNCTVEGCTRPANYKQEMICQMHYFRRMRNGHFGLKQSKYQRLGYHEHSNGYRVLIIPGHPLSSSRGEVYEHRSVVFKRHGWGLPPCEICGAESDWNTRKTHIDHIDEDRANNRPENLRVLCNYCNVSRTKKSHHSYSHCQSITVNGKTMTPTEWARQPNVNVHAATIRHRIKSGYSPYDALYAAKITHNGNARK